MERSIPQLMVISGNAVPIISIASLLLMLVASVLFIISLVNFYKASRTKLKSDYSKAFRFSGNGFLLLGILEAALVALVGPGLKMNAMFAALFFILLGAAASYIGELLKPKPNGRK